MEPVLELFLPPPLPPSCLLSLTSRAPKPPANRPPPFPERRPAIGVFMSEPMVSNQEGRSCFESTIRSTRSLTKLRFLSLKNEVARPETSQHSNRISWLDFLWLAAFEHVCFDNLVVLGYEKYNKTPLT